VLSQPILTKHTPEGSFLVFDHKPDIELVTVKQIHTTNIYAANDIKSSLSEYLADGIRFQSCAQIVPAILTADCMPVLILGKNHNLLLHIGWRGLQQNFIHHREMALAEPFYVYIGPHINKCCFEVGLDFPPHFPKSKNFQQHNGKSYFNLANELIDQIKSKRASLQIEVATECTCCNLKFHSYRRDRTPKRNGNLFVPSSKL